MQPSSCESNGAASTAPSSQYAANPAGTPIAPSTNPVGPPPARPPHPMPPPRGSLPPSAPLGSFPAPIRTQGGPFPPPPLPPSLPPGGAFPPPPLPPGVLPSRNPPLPSPKASNPPASNGFSARHPPMPPMPPTPLHSVPQHPPHLYGQSRPQLPTQPHIAVPTSPAEASPGSNPQFAAPVAPPAFAAARPNVLQQQEAAIPGPMTGTHPQARAPAEDASPAAESILELTVTAVLNERGYARRMGVPLGLVLTPLPDGPVPIILPRPPVRCGRCGAALNPFCRVNGRNGSWTCVLCQEPNQASGVLAAQAVESCEELVMDAADYVRGGPEADGSVPQLQLGGSAPEPGPTVLAVDVTGSAEELVAFKAVLLQVLDELPGNTRLALITFAASIALHRLAPSPPPDSGPASPSQTVPSGSPLPALLPAKAPLAGASLVGLAEADVLPGHAAVGREAFAAARAGGRQHVGRLDACRESFRAAIMSLRPLTRNGPLRERPRCLGAALEAAIHIASWALDAGGAAHAGGQTARSQGEAAQPGGSQRPGQVLVITTGPATQGPGTIPLASLDSAARDPSFLQRQAAATWQRVGSAAALAGVAVDIVATGVAAVNLAQLGPLARGSGGALLVQEEVGKPLAGHIAAALQRRRGFHARLELRASPALRVLREGAVGAVTLLEEAAGGATWRLPSLEAGQGVCIGLEVAHEVSPSQLSHHHIQAILSWTSPEGALVERVVTRRLRNTARLPADAGILPRPAALLAAKAAIAEAQRLNAAADRHVAAALRARLGAFLARLAESAGVERREPGRGWRLFGGGGRRLWELPDSLQPLAEALYHLARGPMLGAAANHPDERAAAMAAFLAAAPGPAAAMMQPRAHLLAPGAAGFEPVAPVDVALFSDCALVLDAGTDIYIWLGRDIPGSADAETGAAWERGAAEEACRQLAGRLAAGRFPAPEVKLAVEGTGDARYVTARLAPLQADPPALQSAAVPRLVTLSPESRAAHLAKLPPSEEPSLSAWLRNLNVRFGTGKAAIGGGGGSGSGGPVQEVAEGMGRLAVTGGGPSQGGVEGLGMLAVAGGGGPAAPHGRVGLSVGGHDGSIEV